MTIYDYTIAVGKKQGNSKDFKNFTKICLSVMELERQNYLAKELIKDKTNRLISMEQNERELKSKISGLEIELQKLKRLSDQQELKIDNLMDEKVNGF